MVAQVTSPLSGNGVLPAASASSTTGTSSGLPTGISVPSLGTLTPTTPTTSTYGPSTGTAGTGAASTVGQLSQAASQNTNAATLTNGQINPNDSTNSASQLDAITSENSPYIQLAEQQGLLSAASRGLENSSLGAGASEAAAVAAAAPLAQQNASEASAADLQNAQLGTQASEFNSSQQTAAQELNAQEQTAVSQSNAQLQTSNSEFNAQAQQSSDAANAAAKNTMSAQTAALTEDLNKQDLSGTQAANLAQIQANSNQLIASNQSAASLYSTYLSSMSATMANQNISPTRAADTITAMQSMVQSGLGVIDAINGMSLDVTLPTSSGAGNDIVTNSSNSGVTATKPATATSPAVTTTNGAAPAKATTQPVYGAPSGLAAQAALAKSGGGIGSLR